MKNQNILFSFLSLLQHELATRDQIERVQDEILDINPETPIVRTDKGKFSWVHFYSSLHIMFVLRKLALS